MTDTAGDGDQDGDLGASLFPGFEPLWVGTDFGRFFARAGGPAGAPPLLLLHGFPETHAMWHRLAPALARDFRVICLDLPGYGWSDAPRADDPATYSKSRMARAAVAVMERIGHAHFALAGHDRGARVGYRLALEEPGRLARLALLDIVPTSVQWERIAAKPAMNPHWPFLARPAPEPERAIGADPDAYYEGLLRDWTKAGDLSVFDPRALALYRQSWNAPERIHAMCADYRAGAGPDRAADLADLAAGRRIALPTLVLSSAAYLDHDKPETALQAWRRTFAPDATGATLDSGHFLAEEAPEATLEALRAFLAA